MPLSQPCLVTGCLLAAWHSCERCHRPFCDAHTRWHRHAFVQGPWAICEFLCYACLPRTADESNGSDRDNEGESESGQ